jgi:8-oxo-dGTP pyrophosphatase MutT (NUDIX family)
MRERSETSAGGVVFRRSETTVEVAVGEQHDRLTRELTCRLPKGRTDPGETLEQTALREVAEEFGLRTRSLRPLGASRHVYTEDDVAVRKQVHYFLLECLPGEPMPLDGEMNRVVWCSLDDAESMLTFDNEKLAIGWARDQLEAAEALDAAEPAG